LVLFICGDLRSSAVPWLLQEQLHGTADDADDADENNNAPLNPSEEERFVSSLLLLSICGFAYLRTTRLAISTSYETTPRPIPPPDRES
jgi:hypothetical protein